MANLFKPDWIRNSYPSSKAQEYLETLRPEVLKLGDAMRRGGFGSCEIALVLPGDEIGPELWAELDGSTFMGVPITVDGDVDEPCILMQLPKPKPRPKLVAPDIPTETRRKM